MDVVSSKSDEWNAIAKNALPTDTTIKEKFLNDNLDPALEDFVGSFSTQKGQEWARARADQFRQHMFEKTSADMSSKAADDVEMNVKKTVNLGINTVSNDPSSLDFIRNTIKGTIGDIADSSPNLTPQANAKVKGDLGFAAERELVHAAISAVIAKGGNWKAMADDPKNAAFINRAELNTLDKQAQAEARHAEIEQKQLTIANRQEVQQKADGDINKIWGNGVTFDDSGAPNIKAGTVKNLADVVRQYPNAPREVLAEVSARINWIQSQQKEKKENVATDPAVKSDFLKRMDDDARPTSAAEIWQAAAEGKLSPQDRATFLGMQKNTVESKELKPERELFLKRYELQIDTARDQQTGAGVPSPLGQANMLRAEMDLRRRETELRRSGQDPHSLYDPASPNFFGKPENIAKYQPTMQQQVQYNNQLKATAAGKPPAAAAAPAGADKPMRYVPPGAIQRLRDNPSMAPDFDAHYGAGQAAKILGK